MITIEIKIKNELSQIARVTKTFKAFANKNDIPIPVATELNIVFDELLSNVMSHAYRDEGEHEIKVQMELLGKRLTVIITDDGVPFHPLSADTPHTDTSLEDRELSGIGIHLARSLVDVTYHRRLGKNVATLTKRLE